MTQCGASLTSFTIAIYDRSIFIIQAIGQHWLTLTRQGPGPMGSLCHLCLWDNTWWLGSIIYSGFKASASWKKINNIVIRERIRKVGRYSSLVYEEDNASLGQHRSGWEWTVKVQENTVLMLDPVTSKPFMFWPKDAISPPYTKESHG
jgi:hypothetical protein